MNTPKVSVIIPVYNAESTVEKCVDSVIAQDYSNIECIIVNDGSTDGTDTICRSLSDKYVCIKYLRTTNFGVSHARNTGLDAATGDYVVFVDADDYIFENSISSRVEKAGKTSLVFSGYCEDSLDNSYILAENIVNDDIQVFLKDLFYAKLYGYQGYSVNKIFSLQIIRDNNIRFNEEIYYNEDRLFVYEYALHCNNVRYISKCLYCYVQTAGSAMNSVKQKHYNHKQITELTAFREMDAITSNNEIKNAISYACFNSCYSLLGRIPKNGEFKQDIITIRKIRNKCFRRYFWKAWHIGELKYKFRISVKLLVSFFK